MQLLKIRICKTKLQPKFTYPNAVVKIRTWKKEKKIAIKICGCKRGYRNKNLEKKLQVVKIRTWKKKIATAIRLQMLLPTYKMHFATTKRLQTIVAKL